VPLYDYRCETCGARFTHLAKSMSSSHEAPPVPCATCGSSSTHRVMAPFSVHGPSGADPAHVAAESTAADRAAAITPKEQIDTWRSGGG